MYRAVRPPYTEYLVAKYLPDECADKYAMYQESADGSMVFAGVDEIVSLHDEHPPNMVVYSTRGVIHDDVLGVPSNCPFLWALASVTFALDGTDVHVTIRNLQVSSLFRHFDQGVTFKEATAMVIERLELYAVALVGDTNAPGVYKAVFVDAYGT